MPAAYPYRLFEAYGVEIEYMIVDRESRRPVPLAHLLLTDDNQQIHNTKPMGPITISNELAGHVIELKSTTPSADLAALACDFQTTIAALNKILVPHHAQLATGGMHPFMDPRRDSGLWQYGDNAIYQWYDQTFDCRRHGWLNLQSCHLNLPFGTEIEFAHLHDAIILLLPMLPALSASSPYMEGRYGGHFDTRLYVYAHNQERFPHIVGDVIPEPIRDRETYQREILGPAYDSVKPFDQQGIIEPDWLNSRGAIARFDRGAIEIRILDTQECPQRDLALCSVIAAILQMLAALGGPQLERWVNRSDTLKRKQQLMSSVQHGRTARFILPEVADALDLPSPIDTVGEFWTCLLDSHPQLQHVFGHEAIKQITQFGSLSERLVARFGQNPNHNDLMEMMTQLSCCLDQGCPLALPAPR